MTCSVLSATLAQIGKPSFWGQTYTTGPSRGEQPVIDRGRQDQVYLAMLSHGEPIRRVDLADKVGMTSSILERALHGLRRRGLVRMVGENRTARWEAIHAENAPKETAA